MDRVHGSTPASGLNAARGLESSTQLQGEAPETTQPAAVPLTCIHPTLAEWATTCPFPDGPMDSPLPRWFNVVDLAGWHRGRNARMTSEDPGKLDTVDVIGVASLEYGSLDTGTVSGQLVVGDDIVPVDAIELTLRWAAMTGEVANSAAEVAGAVAAWAEELAVPSEEAAGSPKKRAAGSAKRAALAIEAAALAEETAALAEKHRALASDATALAGRLAALAQGRRRVGRRRSRP